MPFGTFPISKIVLQIATWRKFQIARRSWLNTFSILFVLLYHQRASLVSYIFLLTSYLMMNIFLFSYCVIVYYPGWLLRKSVNPRARCGLWHFSRVIRLASLSMNVRMSVNEFGTTDCYQWYNDTVITLQCLHWDPLWIFPLTLSL